MAVLYNVIDTKEDNKVLDGVTTAEFQAYFTTKARPSTYLQGRLFKRRYLIERSQAKETHPFLDFRGKIWAKEWTAVCKKFQNKVIWVKYREEGVKVLQGGKN